MGHRTYSQLLRESFRQSDNCNVDFYWYNEERKLDTKILRRLLSFSFPHPWIQKQNLDFRYFRVQLANALIAKRLAARKQRQSKYSALHLHTYVPAFLAVDLMAQLPTVVSIDMTCLQSAQGRTAPRFRWTYGPNFWLERRAYESAAQVVTWSEWARKSVIEDYKIDAKKVKAIYPGVNVTRLTPPDDSQREPQKRFNILFVGGDFERKGGHDVLDVFLQEFSEKADLHLATTAPVTCSHPHVHIHNNVKAYTPEWLKLYRQADVFVMPTYSEAFGYVFIEAMSAGLPVIATRINAIPEIVSHGDTGFLIQPGDRRDLAEKIRILMEDSSLIDQMGVKARQIVEHKFNAQKHCHSLGDIFQKISI